MLATLSACAGPQSTLDPAGPSARLAANLWWGMLSFSAIVMVVVVGLWLYAMFRTHRDYDEMTSRRIQRRWLIGGGLILPMVSIVVLLAFGIPAGHRMLPLPLGGNEPLRIEVIGHQWWWEVRYPEHGVITANQIAIPAGWPVDVHVTSADVIHAFWVPRLAGKIDLLPEHTNVLRLKADAPGIYRGQCAEFCGAQHARMAFSLEALDAADFDDWIDARRRDVLARTARTKEHVPAIDSFTTHCAECHTVADISHGEKGPDLSDLGSRTTLGAGTLENSPGATARWLREHQQLKPGNHMPAHDQLSDNEIGAVADWLETLAP